ncbi:MAG: ATP-binding protein [Thermodesulfovibrionia bacterium]|nr:ATP-binding protein [Thermodesulfovibrionia bacterium]
MTEEKENNNKPFKYGMSLRKYTAALLFSWTVIIAVSLLLNIKHHRNTMFDTARIQAQTLIEKDLLYRRWNAGHGGLYAFVTQETQPNPYLEGVVSERDIQTPSGKELTLINPAYMTRQVNELGKLDKSSFGHITSLKPIRSENAADPWERSALEAFEKGVKEVSSLEMIEGAEYMRLMRVLIAEKRCLICHERQGYKEGDIRGGLSVSIPMAPMIAASEAEVQSEYVVHFVMWLFGSLMLGIGLIKLERKDKERSQAEEQIRHQNDLLNNILNSMTHPFYVIDANDYTIKLSNHAAHLEITEKNMTCYELTHNRNTPCDDSEHPCTIKRIKETKKAVTLEHIHHDKDGNPRIVEVHGYPIFDSNGNVSQVIEYNLDITERKQADEDRKLLNKELQQIIYVTSHDLRSPLVNVEGYHKEIRYSLEALSTILKEIDIPEDKKEKIAFIIDKDIPESVKYIDASVVKMDALLSGLLRLSRSGRTELHMEKIDMKRLVSDVFDTLEYQFKEKGASHEAGELPSCTGDDKHINQVFSNLIGNALKYFDPLRPGVIKVSGYKKDGQAFYCVEDNGIGIPPEHLDKIFDIFHQVQRGKGGEGLGLSIVKKIVERHNGKVWVESEVGKGSRFYVSLPV